MKRIILMSLLVWFLSLPGYGQFWVKFEWGIASCPECRWMESALHLPPSAAREYQRIIHSYGKRIEREARRDCRHWDRSAKRIFDLRMERDRHLQALMDYGQFNLYVRLIRETPKRIHDYIGWYNNPYCPDFHPTHDCYWYEDAYWHGTWRNAHGKWAHHFDKRNWFAGKYDRPFAPKPPKPHQPVAPAPPPAHRPEPPRRPAPQVQRPAPKPRPNQVKLGKKNPKKERNAGHQSSSKRGAGRDVGRR